MRYEFGLFGHRLGHSYSQAFFTEIATRLGFDLRYSLLEVPTVELLKAQLAQLPLLHGANVTIPYKQQVQPLLNGLTPEADAIGAVNCLVRTADGNWIGHNTDSEGFRLDLLEWQRQACTPLPSSALVLGQGGAAAAAVRVLSGLGIDVMGVVVRADSQHTYTFKHKRLFFQELATLHLPSSGVVVVNCTPVGTWPDVQAELPIPPDWARPAVWRYDMVYNPSETAFLQRGREAGALTRNGLGMLYAQAEASWRYWQQYWPLPNLP